MIQAIIDALLGNVARSLLAFYEQHHIAINLSIILYGAAIVWGHHNLRRVVRQMESILLEHARGSSSGPNYREAFRLLAEKWQEQYGEKMFVLPSRRDFWLVRVKGSDLVQLLGICPEYVEVALSELLGRTDPIRLGSARYKAWEKYRHQLQIGIRSATPQVR